MCAHTSVCPGAVVRTVSIVYVFPFRCTGCHTLREPTSLGRRVEHPPRGDREWVPTGTNNFSYVYMTTPVEGINFFFVTFFPSILSLFTHPSFFFLPLLLSLIPPPCPPSSLSPRSPSHNLGPFTPNSPSPLSSRPSYSPRMGSGSWDASSKF